MDTSYQKFAKDVSVVGLTNILMSFRGLILLPLFTKTLGAHGYGIWAQVHVTLGLAGTFVGLGLPFALVRFLPAKTDKEEIQEDFYSVLGVVSLTTLIVSIGLIIGADFIAKAFFENATQVVRITGLIVLVQSLNSMFLTFFRAFRQMKRYSIFMIADTYGQAALIAYLILTGYGVFSTVVAVLVVRVIILLILFFLVKRLIGIRRPHFTRIKEFLHFGVFIIPSALCTWVVNSSDRYIIGNILGMTSVGTYSAAYGLGSLPMMIVGVLGFVLPPTLAKLYDEGNIGEVKQHLSYTLKYFLALAIPFVFGSVVLAEPVLRVFSTPEIASEGRIVLPIVALSILIFGISAIAPYIIFLEKRVRLSATLWTIAAVCNVSLNIVVIPWIGIEGAAVTTLIAFSVALGIALYYSWKSFSFRIDWGFIAKSIFASVLMSLAIWGMSPEGNVGTILTVVAGVVIYGIALLLLKAFDRDEFAFFKGLFRGT